MVRNLLLTVCASLCLASLQAKEDWQMVWADEFDYTGLPDSKKWSFDTEGNNWDWGNNEAQNYTPASMRNAWVEDGNLVIEARKETYTWPGDGQTKQYTSARLRTLGKGDWTYGKVEVRALLPTGRGMWPAIWMLPSEEKYGGWPASGELDIMENVGFDPNKIHCNIHTDAYNHKMGTNKGNTVTTSSPSANWHTYSMEWDEDKVIFFLDGNQVFRFDNEHRSYREWPYDQNFHLLLNVAVGGGWGGEQGIDDGVFPQRMLVDYVRVYQMGEEMPKDGELKMQCVFEPMVCEGSEQSIIIDTTGTGTLLSPDKLEVEITEHTASGSMRVIPASSIMVDDATGRFIYKYIPKESATYECGLRYRKGEGEGMQELVYTCDVKMVEFNLPTDYDGMKCLGEPFTIEAPLNEQTTYTWQSDEMTIESNERTVSSYATNDGVINLTLEKQGCKALYAYTIKTINVSKFRIDSISPKQIAVVMDQPELRFLFRLDDEQETIENIIDVPTFGTHTITVRSLEADCIATQEFTLADPSTGVPALGAGAAAVRYNPKANSLQGVPAGAAYRIVAASGRVDMAGVASGGDIGVEQLGCGYYVAVIGNKRYAFVK